MIPRPSGAVRSRSAMSSCGSPKNSVPPPSSSPTSARRSTPTVCEARAADALQLRLALLRVEEREQRAQVGEVEQRQALLVGVAEDEREALLLRLVRAEHLGEQQRAEVGDGRAHRDARADAAEREVLDREAGRRERLAELASRASPAGPSSPPGSASPERSPFMSAAKTGTPASESCSAIPCSVLVLPVPVAPAIRPWRFIIASGTWTAASGTSASSEHPGSELERRALGRVRLGDRLRRTSSGKEPRAMARDRTSEFGIRDPWRSWMQNGRFLRRLTAPRCIFRIQSGYKLDTIERGGRRWAQARRTVAGRGSNGPTCTTTSSASAVGSHRAHVGAARRRATVAAAALRRYVAALGALTGAQAVQMVKAGLKAIYLSGWQVAADANLSGHTYPDQSLYPANSAPALVKRINNALLRADQIDSAEGKNGTYWLAPIVADAEAGFGGPLNAFELMKAFIEAGAAGVHFEDQLSSEKKCGHLGGKVLVPTSQFVRTLVSARLAADVLDVPTVLVARTDALSATLLTSDVDDRDREFRPASGRPRAFSASRLASRRRSRARSPMRRTRTSSGARPRRPTSTRPPQFAEAVHAQYPGKLLAYNCSPSFNWRKHLDDATIASFQKSSPRWDTSSSS